MSSQQNFLKQVILIGLLAGLLDITAAITQFLLSGGSDPVRILLYVASGVFGKAAFEGGVGMALAGFGFHMFNAMAFTIFFFSVYPTIKRVTENPYVLSIGYGAFVWVVMNLIVVPLSNVSRGGFSLRSSIIGMVILIVCIGLPNAVGARRFYAKQ